MSELERWAARFSAPGYLFGTCAERVSGAPGAPAQAGWDGAARSPTAKAATASGSPNAGLDVGVGRLSRRPRIAKAQALAAERGVTLRTVEAENVVNWTWPAEAFDVVAAIFIQFASPDARLGYAGIRQALKAGGLLLMQGYRPEQLTYRTGGPDKAENLYTRSLLAEAFGDFASVTIDEHDSVIREGSGHAGMSALIDLVARKSSPLPHRNPVLPWHRRRPQPRKKRLSLAFEHPTTALARFSRCSWRAAVLSHRGTVANGQSWPQRGPRRLATCHEQFSVTCSKR